MMDYVNEVISIVVKLVITGAGTAFIAYGIPYLKQIGMYKVVQMAVRAAEKLGVTGAIEKSDKKKYVIAALEKMGVKVTPTIEMMIEAAVKEMDIQNDKIQNEFKWLAVVDDKVPNTVLFMLDSPDGDEGYPGNMKVFVRYTFDDENVLTIKWSAVSDKDTICNLTNHSYFNLNGHKSGKVTENHKLKINANFFIPINSNLNPTGEITPVKNTSFDFTESKLIGNGIDRKNEQIGFANGIDHMFVLNHSDEEFVLAAEAEGIDSGITLKCYTSQKGVHVYTANYVDVLSNMGKDSATYGENPAFCLETQGFPDAVNHKNFPTTILKANENYTQTTKYIFGINK